MYPKMWPWVVVNEKKKHTNKYTRPCVYILHTLYVLLQYNHYWRFLNTAPGHSMYLENPYLIALIFWIVPQGLCSKISGSCVFPANCVVIGYYDPILTLTVLNFWKFTSYCSLKPLWSGMGEVVPARTSPTLHPPSPPTMHQLSWLAF